MCASKKDFAKGAFFGAVAGAIAGILAAPSSGKETREKIKKTSQDLLGEGKAKVEDIKEIGYQKADELKEEAETKAQEIEHKVLDAVENALEEATEKIKKVPNKNKAAKSTKKQKFDGVK